jgi:hypothetical protein
MSTSTAPPIISSTRSADGREGLKIRFLLGIKRMVGSCPVCGASLAGRRADASYCSNACRAEAWRLRRLLRRKPRRALWLPDRSDMAGVHDRVARCGLHDPRVAKLRVEPEQPLVRPRAEGLLGEKADDARCRVGEPGRAPSSSTGRMPSKATPGTAFIPPPRTPGRRLHGSVQRRRVGGPKKRSRAAATAGGMASGGRSLMQFSAYARP